MLSSSSGICVKFTVRLSGKGVKISTGVFSFILGEIKDCPDTTGTETTIIFTNSNCSSIIPAASKQLNLKTNNAVIATGPKPAFYSGKAMPMPSKEGRKFAPHKILM